MSNIIVSGDFVDLGTISSVSETAGYPDDNVEDYWFLKRRFRADGVPKSDASFLLKFDFGAAKSVVGVILNDVNFDTARIRADANDLGVNWVGSDFDSGADHTVSLDERVNRYKIYIPAVFDKQWMVVQVPAAASAVGSYQTKWEVGSVIVLATATELTHNMAWGYKRKAEKPYEDISKRSGGIERINLGDNYQWFGNAIFGRRTVAEEADLWTLNLIDLAEPMIFYENDSDTSKAYLCLRDDAYEGTLEYNDLTVGNAIRFKELV